ncbi:hypothetical protein EHS25_005698 [Saitozyma podzolica]|uniref:Uncharacterized protein n=1 Tax=Saitozyma podzolica TaxID=1890683 RepID=A0A427XVR4_9TREE|nr:hypothetical protein EHS25_005698 [Saitozyma podzolica]
MLPSLRGREMGIWLHFQILLDSTQLTTQHHRFREIFARNREALLGSPTPEPAKASVEASSKLGRVWLTAIPFQPSLCHTDFEVITLLGSQATGLANAEDDLTVVSLASKDARATNLPNQDTDPSRLVNKDLDSVAAHKVRHRPKSNLPSHPIVLSLGGMMNGSNTKVFASWKQVMTRGTYNLMLKRLSARVRIFEL